MMFEWHVWMDHSYIHTIILHSRTGRSDKAGCICTCSRTTRSLHSRFACSRTRRCTMPVQPVGKFWVAGAALIVQKSSHPPEMLLLQHVAFLYCGKYALHPKSGAVPRPHCKFASRRLQRPTSPRVLARRNLLLPALGEGKEPIRKSETTRKSATALILNNQEWRHGAMADESLNEWTTTQWHRVEENSVSCLGYIVILYFSKYLRRTPSIDRQFNASEVAMAMHGEFHTSTTIKEGKTYGMRKTLVKFSWFLES